MPFQAPRSFENDLSQQLRKVHGEIMRIVSGPYTIKQKAKALAEYGQILAPWAQAVMVKATEKANRFNLAEWRKISIKISKELDNVYTRSAVANALNDLSIEGAHLIQSLPEQAGLEVEALAQSAAKSGIRQEELQELVYHKGEITAARAELIARTEVARQQSLLTQVRAVSIGSEGYIWRTADDGRVRPTHAALDGKYIRWDDPPECDPGYRAHAGQIFNCRCYPEPVFGETPTQQGPVPDGPIDRGVLPLMPDLLARPAAVMTPPAASVSAGLDPLEVDIPLF